MKNKNLVLFMPSIEGGGVEKNFFIISNYLSEKIKNLEVITTSISSKKKFNKKIKFSSPKSRFWEKSSRKIKYIICLMILIKRIFTYKQIVVFAFQANVYCIILCKILNIKIITRSNTSPDGWSQKKIKKFLYQYFLSKADVVLVNSEEFKVKMKKFFNLDCKCIYNPLNQKEINKLSKIKVKKIYSKGKILKIINIGRMVEQKDQITLLRALNILKNSIKFEAIIMGRGELKNNLKEYINEKKLNKFIKLKNFHNNPFKFLKQCDLFILTSKFEGLPNVLLESIALKKFVISSDCPTGPKEILLNGKGGNFFKIGDYSDLALKIKFIVKNKKLMNKKVNVCFKNNSVLIDKDYSSMFGYNVRLYKDSMWYRGLKYQGMNSNGHANLIDSDIIITLHTKS